MPCDEGIDVAGIFSPEHGFRGGADAGEHVGSSVDEKTRIPIWSLYDGGSGRPSAATMNKFDVLVVDMQDVGLRFYTYYITMLRMMDACADHDRAVIVLDRPNPNVVRSLQGQVPGLTLQFTDGKPSHGATLRIRGIASSIARAARRSC